MARIVTSRGATAHTHSYMRRSLTGMVAGAALVLTACDGDRLAAPNLNSPSATGSADVASSVQFAITGIQAQRRTSLGLFALQTGILGRETFNYTSSEGRNTTGYLVNPLDPTSFGGGSNWSGPWTNLRNIYNLKQTVTGAGAALTAEDAAGILGFAQTMEALELYYLIATRDSLGIPVEVAPNPLDVTPFVSRDSAYSRILGQLDSARTNLQAAGGAFSFALTSGFAGFDTPATFLQFNRALYARVEAIRASLLGRGAPSYQAVLTALGESFINPNPTSAADLARGVYGVFSNSPNDQPNQLSNARLPRVVVAHPSLRADAPQGDLRFAAKTVTLTPPVTAPGGTENGIPTDLGLRVYATDNTPIPIIKNEELILLRAEARYFTGDVAGAVADINTIRTVSGGLAPIDASAIATPDAFITELLLQRRLSLLAEGHRWVDVRRFGRLDRLPRDIERHVVVGYLPVPQQECLVRARAGTPAELRGPGCPGS